MTLVLLAAVWATMGAAGFSDSARPLGNSDVVKAADAPRTSDNGQRVAVPGSARNDGSGSEWNVTFNESGLQTGWQWSVTVDNATVSSTSANISFMLSDGSYAYSIPLVSGYLASTTGGSFSVSGASLNISIAFEGCTINGLGEVAGEPDFYLPLGGTGYYNWTIINYGSCPSGVVIQLPTLAQSGDDTPPTMTAYPSYVVISSGGTVIVELNVSMPDNPADLGVDAWDGLIVGGAANQPCGGGGSCIVPGVAKIVNINAVLFYLVTFKAPTLLPGTNWTLTLNSVFHSSTTNVTTFLEPNGTYSYTATSGRAGTATGSFTVNGVPLSVTVPFCPPSFCKVTFKETGLPPGAGWQVTSNGTAKNSSSGSIVFHLADGPYAYGVGSVAGFYPATTSGTYTVNGENVTVKVTFVAQALSALSVGPYLAPLALGARGTFTAVPSCTLGPCTIAVSYAWSFSPSTLGVLNATSGSSVTFTAGNHPEAGVLFVNATYGDTVRSGTVSVLDVRPRSASVTAGEYPYSLALDSRTGELFVPVIGLDLVDVLSTTTNSIVATVPVGTSPIGAVYDNGRDEVFVTNSGSANVSVISVATDTVVATIPVYPNPQLPAYDSATGEIFVPFETYLGYGVDAISDTTDTVVANIGGGDGCSGCVGNDPGTTTYDSANSEVFVGNDGSNTVTALGIAPNGDISEAATIPVGTDPNVVGYDSNTGEVFASDVESDEMSVISAATDAVVATIPLSVAPVGIAFAPALGEVFVGQATGNTVTVISDATNTVVSTIPVGSSPQALVFDPGNGRLYVSDLLSGNVSVVTVLNVPYHTVKFTEVGLTPAWRTTWCVTFNGLPKCSSSSSISFTAVLNGTHAYTIGSVTNYSLNRSYAGSLTVNGPGQGTSAYTIPLHWNLVKYRVTFREKGLASGTSWQVVFDGVTRVSTSTQITFTVSNGTYQFVANATSETATPGSGNITVNGSTVTKTVTFSDPPDDLLMVVWLWT